MLTVSNATTGEVCIISHATVAGAPVGIASVAFIIVFSLATGIIKKNIKKQQEAKRKSMIKFLYWLKVYSIALKL